MNEQLSNELYNIAMRLTDAGFRDVDKMIEGLCKEACISYPPIQIKANQQPVMLAIN